MLKVLTSVFGVSVLQRMCSASLVLSLKDVNVSSYILIHTSEQTEHEDDERIEGNNLRKLSSICKMGEFLKAY